jgi:hypothetical protein
MAINAIEKLKAIINRLKFKIFLATTIYLTVTGNKENDLASSDENENILRKNGLNTHRTMKKFIEYKMLKYRSFMPKTMGMSMRTAMPNRYI